MLLLIKTFFHIALDEFLSYMNHENRSKYRCLRFTISAFVDKSSL
jgi:hypothetical protein